MKATILRISKELELSHIGSCLSVLPILEEIYKRKKICDKVILDNAHAHLAHLVVMDSYRMISVIEVTDQEHIEHIIKDFGIHCDRRAGCDVNGGSLGHGIGISIGMALTNLKRNVYCVVSDGSMQEGSNWEALRIKKQLRLKNLKIYCNFNGYTAVKKIDRSDLVKRMKAFCSDIKVRYTKNGKDFEGVYGHYKIL